MTELKDFMSREDRHRKTDTARFPWHVEADERTASLNKMVITTGWER